MAFYGNPTLLTFETWSMDLKRLRNVTCRFTFNFRSVFGSCPVTLETYSNKLNLNKPQLMKNRIQRSRSLFKFLKLAFLQDSFRDLLSPGDPPCTIDC